MQRATVIWWLAAGVYLAQPFLVSASEDEYLVGDWNHDNRDNLAVRRETCILKDYDFDGIQNAEQCFGSGSHSRGYLVGDWDGDGDDNLAFRVMNQIFFDYNDDRFYEDWIAFGGGHKESEYMSGDWDGDGRDELATRQGNCIFMDYDRDTDYDRVICLDTGSLDPDEYLVGNWDGMWGDSFAIRVDNCVYKDVDGDGWLELDTPQCYGTGNTEDQYLVGDWDGDGTDNLAVRRGFTVLMDWDGDGIQNVEQHYGQGVEIMAPQRRLTPHSCHWFSSSPDPSSFVVIDSFALATTVLRKLGNNASANPTTIGIRHPDPAQAWGLFIEDDPTIATMQTRVVMNNESDYDTAFTAGNCADNRSTPVTVFVPARQSRSVIISIESANTLILDGTSCAWFSCERSPAVAFWESNFGTLAAGRKLTFRYLRR